MRPGDFSIGPHADLQYGHTPVTVNFYAPLTTIGGSNALFLESEVGAENWRPIGATVIAISLVKRLVDTVERRLWNVCANGLRKHQYRLYLDTLG